MFKAEKNIKRDVERYEETLFAKNNKKKCEIIFGKVFAKSS